MSETRTTDIDAAVTHIQQAMEKIEHLNRTWQEGVTTQRHHGGPAGCHSAG